MTVPTALTLADLPAPPPGKVGWPWTDQSELLFPQQPNGEPWPCISIVTPSYNQGQFIEETIRSVLLQGYPNLEYIIIDGGSTDNTIDIIKKYEPFISYWVSEPDRGQSHAINKGLKKATGDLIGWQNSDDCYQPNALSQVARGWLGAPEIDIIYGSVDSVDTDSKLLFSYPVSEFNLMDMLPWANMFNQSMFFNSRILRDDQLYIHEKFHHYMDLELFWRLALKNYTFKFIPEVVASFRLHQDAKGFTQYDVAAREAVNIYLLIYSNINLPSPVRRKALRCSINQCIDCFDKLKIDLFQELFKTLVSQAGIATLNFQLILKYLVSMTGEYNVRKLKQSWATFSSSSQGA